MQVSHSPRYLKSIWHEHSDRPAARNTGWSLESRTLALFAAVVCEVGNGDGQNCDIALGGLQLQIFRLILQLLRSGMERGVAFPANCPNLDLEMDEAMILDHAVLGLSISWKFPRFENSCRWPARRSRRPSALRKDGSLCPIHRSFIATSGKPER